MSRRNVSRIDPNDWAAKRKAQIEIAKQKREERAMMGDECTEEHTFKPKVNPRPKYLERGRHDSSDSLDQLTGGANIGNDIFEQPLPGSKRSDPNAIYSENPPSPSSDALGHEIKRYPHQPQVAPSQNNATGASKDSVKSPYRSKFMQQYDEQVGGIVNSSCETKPNLAQEVDANFFSSLRSGGESSTSQSKGWNDDTSNCDIPSLGPPTRKVSYRRRKSSNNSNSNPPEYNSNRSIPSQQDQPSWNSDTQYEPTPTQNSRAMKPTPTAMVSQGGDIGQARSRLSLLKNKMRRSDAANVPVRPNNGEATNLKNVPKKQNSAPSRRDFQLAEDGWNNDFSTPSASEIPKPSRRRQSHSDQSDYTVRSGSGGLSSRRGNGQLQYNQNRWQDPNEMTENVGSTSLPNSAQGSDRAESFQDRNARLRKPTSPPREGRPPRSQAHSGNQQHSARSIPSQQSGYDIPPDAYPSGDPFGGGMDEGGGDQKQCPDCGRKFNPIPFEKHIKICAKVFKEKRKTFDSKKMRIESVAAENPDFKKVLNQQKKMDRRQKQSGKENDRALAASAKKAKWKADSEAFRAALRAGKAVAKAQATGGPMPEYVESAPDPSFIPCPNCGRTFNEKAAERHIPKCKDIRAKPSTLKRGTGGAGGKTGTRPNPVKR